MVADPVGVVHSGPGATSEFCTLSTCLHDAAKPFIGMMLLQLQTLGALPRISRIIFGQSLKSL